MHICRELWQVLVLLLTYYAMTLCQCKYAFFQGREVLYFLSLTSTDWLRGKGRSSLETGCIEKSLAVSMFSEFAGILAIIKLVLKYVHMLLKLSHSWCVVWFIMSQIRVCVFMEFLSTTLYFQHPLDETCPCSWTKWTKYFLSLTSIDWLRGKGRSSLETGCIEKSLTVSMFSESAGILAIIILVLKYVHILLKLSHSWCVVWLIMSQIRVCVFMEFLNTTPYFQHPLDVTCSCSW
jgi:hypothetical protein